ncbi:hypothetical protein HYH03_009705 [Edaphochlamys debaryana]|uniref:Uncharacterized protein n=1 Tax=Edaphochlamys debaryana TaxID=47281 RepID=A0A835Y6M6_9CHLO|nr:hypothetical protein HYH03_009705 [Edaphochlamys debaryana]|eukprot:KAG2491974.1 hypothetical protein HYH03_009705 [Edaphochlamys debaryana]
MPPDESTAPVSEGLAPPWARRSGPAGGASASVSATASGPPLTPAQRRLLVAAGAGIPARLLSSRPSQQAQALAQQPLRGAWRAGATYRPALRAAATAALTAAASAASLPAASVGLCSSMPSSHDSNKHWRHLQEAWLKLIALQRRPLKSDPIPDSTPPEATATAITEAVDEVILATQSLEAEAARLAEGSGQGSTSTSRGRGGKEKPRSAFLGDVLTAGSQARAPGSPEHEQTELARAVLLLTGNVTAFLRARDSCPPEVRQAGLDAAVALAQALVLRYGGPTLTFPELLVFAFQISALEAFLNEMLGGRKDPADCLALPHVAALTSVPALARLAQATHQALAAATPYPELQPMADDLYDYASHVAQVYLTSLIAPPEGMRAEHPISTVTGSRQRGWGAERTAEALERCCSASMRELGLSCDQGTPCGSSRTYEDSDVLAAVLAIMSAMCTESTAKIKLPALWLSLREAQSLASSVRVTRCRHFTKIGAWLPGAIGGIARAVCGSGSGNGGDGREFQSKRGGQQPGSKVSSGVQRIDVGDLASPSARAALARALLTAHLDQEPAVVTGTGSKAFTLLSAAAAALTAVRGALEAALAPLLSESTAEAAEQSGERCADLGWRVGLLLRPTPEVAEDDRADQAVGTAPAAGQLAAWEVALVPLPSKLPVPKEKVPVHGPNGTGSAMQVDALRRVRAGLAADKAITLEPRPPGDEEAVEAAPGVAHQVLRDVRAAGREALLLPLPAGPLRALEAAKRHVVEHTVAGVSSAHGRSRRHCQGEAAPERAGLKPGWQLRRRVAVAQALAGLLQDGVHNFEDLTGSQRRC